MRHATTTLILLALIVAPAVAGDWPRFRGANGSGVSDATGLPTDFGPETNKVWESDVPFGRSSPVLSGDRIFLSALEDKQLVTLALDRSTGETIWRSVAEPRRSDTFHHDTDSATTTPATDGTNVYMFFQELGLISYDTRGKERWRLELGPFRNFYGISASPVLAGDTLFMVCDQAEGSFIVAVDKDSGKERWRRSRPARAESYSTPVLYPGSGKPKALIVHGSQWLDAYDLATGEVLWTVGNVGSPVSSPVLSGNTVFLVAPHHGESGWAPFAGMLEEYDGDGNGELSPEEVAEAWLSRHFGWLDNDASGSISARDWKTVGDMMMNDNWGAYAVGIPTGSGEPEILWNYRKNVSHVASPLVHEGVFYMVEKGILTSLDAKTGEVLKRDRLGKGSPKVYSSPVAADGKIYIGTIEGTLFVLRAAGEWKTLASVDLGDEIWATPAVVDGRLYVRTRDKLYSFGSVGK